MSQTSQDKKILTANDCIAAEESTRVRSSRLSSSLGLVQRWRDQGLDANKC